MDLTYYDPYSTYNASLIPFLTGQLRELMICYKMMHNYPNMNSFTVYIMSTQQATRQYRHHHPLQCIVADDGTCIALPLAMLT